MMRIVFSLLILISVFSCKKSEDRSCFKVVGGLSTKEVELSSFNHLYMGPHLKYIFVQDNVEKVILIGGKNLLNFIQTDVESGKLTINNNNKCNFIRSYDKLVTVEIHYKKLNNIVFEGTEEVTSRNKMNTDYLTVALRDGAGQFNLNVDALVLQLVISHGWSNYSLTGDVNHLKLDVRSNGFGNSYGLNVSDSLLVISSSSERLEINADNCLLRSETNGIGDIWYKGYPTIIEHISYGDGELIEKN